MHPRVTNPILTEIRGNLGRIYGSLDELESSSSGSVDLLTISWMAKFLAHFDHDATMDFLARCEPIIKELLLGKPPNLKNILTTELQGLFNYGREIFEAAMHDSGALQVGFDRLLAVLASASWLHSPSLAAYAIYGLKGIVSDEYIEDAERYVKVYFGADLTEQVFKYPEVFLGLPSLLDREDVRSRLKSKDIIPGPPSARALLLFAMTNSVGKAAESTELLYSLLEKCTEDMKPDTEELNLVSQSLLGLSFFNLALVQVHLVNTMDYEKVSRFFETETVPVPKKVEYIQEIIVLCCVALVILVEVAYASPIVVSYLQIITGPLSVEFAALVLASLNGFLFYKLLAPFLLPELSRSVHRVLSGYRRKHDLE